MGPPEEGFVGDVQTESGYFDAGAKDNLGRLRVDINIKFGGGGDVAAFRPRAAHQDDLRDAWNNLGRAGEGGGNICQRPCRNEHDVIGLAADADNRVDRIFGLQGNVRFKYLYPVQPLDSMNLFGCSQGIVKGRVASGVNRDILYARKFAQSSGRCADILRGSYSRPRR